MTDCRAKELSRIAFLVELSSSLRPVGDKVAKSHPLDKNEEQQQLKTAMDYQKKIYLPEKFRGLARHTPVYEGNTSKQNPSNNWLNRDSKLRNFKSFRTSKQESQNYSLAQEVKENTSITLPQKFELGSFLKRGSKPKIQQMDQKSRVSQNISPEQLQANLQQEKSHIRSLSYGFDESGMIQFQKINGDTES